MDNSAEIKARWNAEHYDQMSVVVPKGSRDLIKQHANSLGMSISEYIRHLIAQDAPQCITAPYLNADGGGGRIAGQ
jgi:hypothetical protein